MPGLPDPVRPGDPITAGLFNAIAEALERFHNLDVAPGGYLRIDKHPGGIGLWLAVPQGIWARLSGTTSPYSWTEVEPLADGTWATFSTGRSGTADAYEYNAKGGLGGKVVKLRSTGVGDWRFKWTGVGPVTCTSTTRICATVTDGCTTPAGVYGATVTVKQGATTIGTCTTDASGQCCVTVTESGSYTVEASLPGATTVTQSVSVTCNVDNAVSLAFDRTTNPVGTVCITGTLCDGATGGIAIQPSISITGAGSVSATGDPSGMTCFKLGAGSYSATLSHGGYSETRSFTVSACATTSIAFSVVSGTYVDLFFGVAGCAYTFTVKDGGGVTVGTCTITADGSGNGHCTITYAERQLSNVVTGTITVTATVTNGTSGFAFNCYTPAAPFSYNAGHVC